MNIGIIGAGKIGGTLGAIWALAGHKIKFGTPHPASLHDLVAELAPNVSAVTPDDAALMGEVILFAAPDRVWPDFARRNASALAGKIVIDAASPDEADEEDDCWAEDEAARTELAERARLLSSSRVVRAFHAVLWSSANGPENPEDGILGIPVTGDDPGAVENVAQLVRDAGFEPVVMGVIAGAADSADPLSAAAIARALDFGFTRSGISG
jgi:8-hydroxy-5-deazaflavin:NADPH oxidoreductase